MTLTSVYLALVRLTFSAGDERPPPARDYPCSQPVLPRVVRTVRCDRVRMEHPPPRFRQHCSSVATAGLALRDPHGCRAGPKSTAKCRPRTRGSPAVSRRVSGSSTACRRVGQTMHSSRQARNRRQRFNRGRRRPRRGQRSLSRWRGAGSPGATCGLILPRAPADAIRWPRRISQYPCAR